ncbi:NAD(P)H-hydrate dehydratase [Sphingomonas sp. ASV193]|uniref:NAD(P)H-hydrate dehydratase n=1 Tax=Sphingomonas sp. ASV193 TaxID=3144405 RepID=UPI0032E8ACCB
MSRPILTAAAMRAAEQSVIERGATVETLMERAGAALAEAVMRFTWPMDTLVLVGPGNNGGDGNVASRVLREAGWPVRVVELGEAFDRAENAPLVIDCLFGTGLSRPLEEAVSTKLLSLVSAADLAVACDLPSGVASDDGTLLSPVGDYDLTVTFGALKPAHRLMPAMAHMGRVVLADIGVDAAGDWFEIGAPDLPPIDPAGHKYSRGLVHALAGTMPGAIALSATASAKAGAGYVRVSTSKPIEGLPHAVVQVGTADMADERIGCLLVGPGLGDLPQVLTLALTSKAPKLIDADAIGLVGEPERLKGQDAILTPHAGEFAKLFGELAGSKAEVALAAAEASGAVVVYKGPDTLVAAPDGRLGFASPAPAWLASAGTGDVLAGVIAACRARGMEAFDAACAGVWLHGRAAEAAGPAMIADDLVAALPSIL